MSSDCCKLERSCSVNKVILSNGHFYVYIFLGMTEDNFPAIRFVLFYSIKTHFQNQRNLALNLVFLKIRPEHPKN